MLSGMVDVSLLQRDRDPQQLPVCPRTQSDRQNVISGTLQLDQVQSQLANSPIQLHDNQIEP